MYNCQSFCDIVVDIHDGIISNVQLAVISEWISPVSNAVYLELNIVTQAKNLKVKNLHERKLRSTILFISNTIDNLPPVLHRKFKSYESEL